MMPQATTPKKLQSGDELFTIRLIVPVLLLVLVLENMLKTEEKARE